MRFVTGGCLPDFPPAARQVFDSRHRRLTEVFGMCAETYNALVEWWRGSYLWWCEHNNRETGRYLSPSRVRSAPPAERGPSGRSEWSVLSVKVRRGSSAVSRTGYPFLLRPMCAHPVDERGPCGLPPFPPADVPDVPVLKPVGLYKGTDDAVYHFGWGRCRRKGCGLAGDTPHAETRQPGKARLAVAGVESGGPRAALVAGDRRGAPVRVPSRSHRIVSKHDAVVVEDLAVSNILNSTDGSSRTMLDRHQRPSTLCWITKLGKLVSGARRGARRTRAPTAPHADTGIGCRCPQRLTSVAARRTNF